MYISDETVLNMERTRAKLVDILRDKGVYVEDGTSINDLVNKVNELDGKNITSDMFLGTFESIRNDEIKTLKPYCFYNNKNLTKVYLPNVKSLYTHSFDSCSSLKNIYLPNLEVISYIQNFNGCSAVKTLILPKLKTWQSDYALYGMGNLIRLIIPNSPVAFLGSALTTSSLELMESRCFPRAKALVLKTLILRNTESIPVLENETYISNIEEIYITSSLVDSLKSSTNCCIYADKIHPLEGTKYESLTWYEDEDWYKEEMTVWQ